MALMQHSTGKERDTETGLDYFGARFYGSNMGRWMSPDWADKPSPIPHATLFDPQTLNLYSHVRNNPLKYVDYDGHDSVKIDQSVSCGNSSCLLYHRKVVVTDIKDETGKIVGQATTETVTYAQYDISGDLPKFTGGSQTVDTTTRDVNGNVTSHENDGVGPLRERNAEATFGDASRVYDAIAAKGTGSVARSVARDVQNHPKKYAGYAVEFAVAVTPLPEAYAAYEGLKATMDVVVGGVHLAWDLTREER